MAGKGTMRACSIKAYGAVDDNVSVVEDWPKPTLRAGKGEMLIRVCAVALAPGDCRVLSGKTSLVQGPKRFPYIGGGDVSGVVVQVDEGEKDFAVGDQVFSLFDGKPMGRLAEFALVKTKLSCKKPANISLLEASTLGSSAFAALRAAEKGVRKGDRVLILGATGGVGPFLVQLAKLKGASFVAASGLNTELLSSLPADRVIDYSKENWWEIEEIKDGKFDMVFDLAGGRTSWREAKKAKAVKSGWNGGRYYATVWDNPYMVIQHWYQVFNFPTPILLRFWYAKLNWAIPTYRYLLVPGSDNPRPVYERLNKIIEAGDLRVVLSPGAPFPFTTEGVREAYNLQKSRHPNGKVVIKVADDL
ncbi:NADPH-dependent alkenal/one oxidoreductase [Durusdinium trenchii]|uniref:Chloroplastic (AtAOR) n=1 Tax=Durusdinium trenchii TaxID=1381693 RepID=A0ABP0JSK3_9DINO